MCWHVRWHVRWKLRREAYRRGATSDAPQGAELVVIDWLLGATPRPSTPHNTKAFDHLADAMNSYLTVVSEAPRAVPGAPNRLTIGESRLREAHTTI